MKEAGIVGAHENTPVILTEEKKGGKKCQKKMKSFLVRALFCTTLELFYSLLLNFRPQFLFLKERMRKPKANLI